MAPNFVATGISSEQLQFEIEQTPKKNFKTVFYAYTNLTVLLKNATGVYFFFRVNFSDPNFWTYPLLLFFMAEPP